jgi:hypothetical protein
VQIANGTTSMSEHKAAEAWFKDTPNTCFYLFMGAGFFLMDGLHLSN